MTDLEQLCMWMVVNDLATGHADNMSEALQSLDEELRSIRTTTAAKIPEWISVSDALPEGNCLATYVNSYGNKRTIVAFYAKQYSISDDSEDCFDYSEQDDCYYLQEGWWERIDNWCDFTHVKVCEGVITHWMPLPSLRIVHGNAG